MTLSTRKDPFLGFNFRVEIDGFEVGGFKEVSGLHIKIENTPYYEGGGRGVVHNLIGRPSFGSVTLHKGMTSSTELWDWVLSTAEGDVQTRHVSIVLCQFDPAGAETRWDLMNAVPTEWQGGYLNAMQSSVAIESLTLVFSSIKRESKITEQVTENVQPLQSTTIV